MNKNSGQEFIDRLLSADDINKSIIELDNYICERCVWGEEIDKLNQQQKNFYYNQELEREINNGGFNQYFLNSSGNFAHQTIESLCLIKANKTAEILREAIGQFPVKTVPEGQSDRQEILEQIEENANEKWEDLEQKFFLYEDDLNSLNMEYIRENKEAFY